MTDAERGRYRDAMAGHKRTADRLGMTIHHVTWNGTEARVLMHKAERHDQPPEPIAQGMLL